MPRRCNNILNFALSTDLYCGIHNNIAVWSNPTTNFKIPTCLQNNLRPLFSSSRVTRILVKIQRHRFASTITMQIYHSVVVQYNIY